MKLGLSSYTYTWAIGVPGYPLKEPITAFDLLDKAIEAGVQVVQIADNLPLERMDKNDLDGLQRKAKCDDILVEVGTRGIQPDHLLTYLAIAREFDSPILRVVIDSGDNHPAVHEVINLLSSIIPAFKDAGVILAIENHDRFCTSEFIDILEAIDSPYLGICLDTVNSFGALEGPDTVIEALGPWTVNLHIKDFDIRRADHKMGFIIEGTPAGKGRLDIQRLFTKLANYGRTFNAILELWTAPEKDTAATIAKEAQWAHTSIQYLQNLLADWEKIHNSISE